MKILQVYKDYYPPMVGGIETHIHLLCQYLQPEFEMEVLIANRGRETTTETIHGVKVTKIGEWGRISSAPITPTFHRWLKNIHADIYHFHHPNPTAELAYLLAGCPGKLVVTYHSDIVRQSFILPVYKPFLNRFLNKAVRILATSPNYIASSPILNRFENKCMVVPLGIEIERFALTKSIKSKALQIRNQYPCRLLLLFVGKLRYYKGLPVLLKAMKHLDETHLIIIGSSPVSGEEKPLKNMAKELNIESKIHFLGEVSDEELPAFYHACDIFCLPATHRSEAYGVVQLEAHACGKPVISTNLDSGVPFVNKNNETGLIVLPGSVEELKSAITRLGNNPKLILEMGQNAKKRVETEFTAQHMVNQIKSIYRHISS